MIRNQGVFYIFMPMVGIEIYMSNMVNMTYKNN